MIVQSEWSLTDVLSRHDYLQRLCRAAERSATCRQEGVRLNLITAMLNKWWPRAAASGDGVWTDTVTTTLLNAAKYVWANPPPADAPERRHPVDYDILIGQLIVRKMCILYLEFYPHVLDAVEDRLLLEEAENTIYHRMPMAITRITGVDPKCIRDSDAKRYALRMVKSMQKHPAQSPNTPAPDQAT